MQSLRIWFIGLPLLLFMACASPKIGIYKTAANDIATIELTLKKNNSFDMQFRDLEETRTYVFKGKWSEHKEHIRLEFKLDKKGLPDIYALFDPNLTEDKSIRILDNRRVEFRKKAQTIYIWGIACPKQKLNK